MSILDRILLFLLALASLVLGISLALVGVRVISSDVLATVSSTPENIVAIVAGVIIVIIALRFLFYRVSRRPSTDYVAMTGEHGQIRISYDTIRQLANRKGTQLKGAEGFDSRIRQGPEGIIVLVRMQVLPDVDIAALSRDVQTTVKDYVEQTSGVKVERVLVHVTELSAGGQRQGKAWNGV